MLKIRLALRYPRFGSGGRFFAEPTTAPIPRTGAQTMQSPARRVEVYPAPCSEAWPERWMWAALLLAIVLIAGADLDGSFLHNGGGSTDLGSERFFVRCSDEHGYRFTVEPTESVRAATQKV